MSLISRLTTCFSWKNPPKYTDLAKQAEQWVNDHPIAYIQKEIRYSNFKKVNKYANEVIHGLKNIPISSSNIELIKFHLVEMSKKSSNLNQALFKKIPSLQAERALKISIMDALGSTFEIS